MSTWRISVWFWRRFWWKGTYQRHTLKVQSISFESKKYPNFQSKNLARVSCFFFSWFQLSTCFVYSPLYSMSCLQYTPMWVHCTFNVSKRCPASFCLCSVLGFFSFSSFFISTLLLPCQHLYFVNNPFRSFNSWLLASSLGFSTQSLTVVNCLFLHCYSVQVRNDPLLWAN